MKTTFGFTIKKRGGGPSILRKTVDLPFTFQKGMSFGDYAWEDGKQVISVCFTLEEDPASSYFYVALEDETVKDGIEQKSRVDFYTEHDWEEL